MNNTPDNAKIGITLRGAPTTPPEPTPTPAERNAYAAAARDRLREATLEAFPRSQQYRPAGDKTGSAGSGEA